MKRTNLILMLLTLCVSLFAQPVTLTFTGRDAKNQHVQLNRVVITNLTQNWQETIYYPDTILMMGSTGIDEVDHANGMKLSQNVPNPFDGTTDFALQLPEAGKVSLIVYDLNGKKITAYQGKLAAGVHTFRVLLNTTQSYLLTARCGSEMATIKMINNGNAGENAIRHLGEANLNMMLKGGKGTSNKPFAFGDNMIYMGYAMINGKECVSQNVEKRQLISETITLSFDNYPPTVTTAPVTEITSHSAMSGGEVQQDGGSAVITKGVCWSAKANPTINDSHIAAGSGLGSFVSALTGLTYGTTYYVRAYAENGMGVSYGNEQSFTTVAITPPVVTTAVVSDITNNSATCGGTIQDMGSQITGRGVCWSTSPNPTVENSCTNDGVGAGTFTSSIKNLDHSMLYYVRAYAITVDGTFYGDEKSFKTQEAKLAMAVTGEVTDIMTIGANCSYTVIDMGTYVTARGVCWSTQPNPTVSDNHTTDGIGAGTFTSQLTNLQRVTTYYVRAYATNSDGTAYGDDKSFTTLGGRPCTVAPTVTDIEGNIYNTVQIGAQCWMKENLRTTKYADGTPIDQGNSTSTTVGYWYYPNNSSSNKATYGLLYNWKAVMRNLSSSSANPSGVQGICPTGWHVPSDAEWTQLTDYVGSQSHYQCKDNSSNIAKALASATGWNSSTSTCAVGNVQSENNTTGFSAVPAGGYFGSYSGFGDYALFWSATENGSHDAYGRYLYYNNANVHRFNDTKYDGFSVRCLRDN
ncbi:MAG: fibrobacter succinogenes major paralogous domain-containing protein [Bacteroidales bacterium]|nr:fibrobacter succinogenes major paralogous domain-containing protein [Bacteroidales bacterium]